MLDIETLGTRAGSVITSIGAVQFSALGLGREFYRRIDSTSCTEIGMTVDLETVNWWMLQGDEARAEMTRPGEPVTAVLEDFAGWIGGPDACIWGNGADFDNALVAEAYRRAGLSVPWKFWNNRCYRTVKSLLGRDIRMEREGTHHNALDDARDQARHFLAIMEACGFPGFP